MLYIPHVQLLYTYGNGLTLIIDHMYVLLNNTTTTSQYYSSGIIKTMSSTSTRRHLHEEYIGSKHEDLHGLIPYLWNANVDKNPSVHQCFIFTSSFDALAILLRELL